MTKKVITFSKKKYRVTPSVIKPGDTNVSDATEKITTIRLRVGLLKPRTIMTVLATQRHAVHTASLSQDRPPTAEPRTQFLLLVRCSVPRRNQINENADKK